MSSQSHKNYSVSSFLLSLKGMPTFFCGTQVVYIAPLKAIVRERMKDWKKHLVAPLGKEMVNGCCML